MIKMERGFSAIELMLVLTAFAKLVVAPVLADLDTS